MEDSAYEDDDDDGDGDGVGDEKEMDQLDYPATLDELNTPSADDVDPEDIPTEVLYFRVCCIVALFDCSMHYQ